MCESTDISHLNSPFLDQSVAIHGQVTVVDLQGEHAERCGEHAPAEIIDPDLAGRSRHGPGPEAVGDCEVNVVAGPGFFKRSAKGRRPNGLPEIMCMKGFMPEDSTQGQDYISIIRRARHPAVLALGHNGNLLKVRSGQAKYTHRHPVTVHADQAHLKGILDH